MGDLALISNSEALQKPTYPSITDNYSKFFYTKAAHLIIFRQAVSELSACVLVMVDNSSREYCVEIKGIGCCELLNID